VSSQTVYELLLGVVVLGLLVYRQLQKRPVSGRRQQIGLVLGVIGVIETVNYLGKVHAGGVVVVALAGSLVLAAVFGAVRAATVRIWIQDGRPWSQGNWLTALLWVVAVAAHLGYEALLDSSKGLSGLGSATVLLYLAVSLLVQYVIVNFRAQRLGAESSAMPGSFV
jgi:hypothetical protein